MKSLLTVVGLTVLIACIGVAVYFYGLAVIVALGMRRPRGLSRGTAWALTVAPWIVAAAFVFGL